MSKLNLKGAREKIAEYLFYEILGPHRGKWRYLVPRDKAVWLRRADAIADIFQDEVKAAQARASRRN